MPNLCNIRRWLLAAGSLMALSSVTVLAQVQNYDSVGDPTNVPKLDLARPLESWALIGVAIVGALAIAFKSSKRGMLD